MIDRSLLDEIIVGRAEPHIYAFETESVPGYLKVGDTARSVTERLREWEEHYPVIKKKYECSAKINDDVYFRDFSVHQFLENERGKERLKLSEKPDGIYYSKEFFKNASACDINDAVTDIHRDFNEKTQKYHFYNAESRLPETINFARTESFDPRPNQKNAIDNFKTAISSGRTNLLMYAVMRFGKSFTAMCCASEMNAKLVVIVSAKADVALEWQRTVESHIRFEEFEFITSRNLSADKNIITSKIKDGKRLAVFLTLQDLQGEEIKDKHEEIFGEEIDLLLVDETHFGARAEKYGEVLRQKNYENDIKTKNDTEDFVEFDEAEKSIKKLRAKITLHLSGTPYRILMGCEFKKEDIIAFYQFTDIAESQKAWDTENLAKPEAEAEEEWKNPYFGFPQMVRFAFVPNESSRIKLEELKKNGTTYAFSELFKPRSIRKSKDGLHKKFKYEKQICELFKVIDGTKKDDALLSFLDYDKLKNGKMCRHIVAVLPYCASCDALEALIKSNKKKFKNLNSYEIINISGVDKANTYTTPEDIKIKIRKLESEGKKTITLTVNRMLTGSTVPEWDTMLYFKDTASPQEYDQAIFRLQNQYIKTYKSDDGNIIKQNMKPQTLLVDFDPRRMFLMQEAKSKIYNANVDAGGNSELERRMEKELKISPIITINKDKIERVSATDILEAVSNYQRDKGIKDEALEIPVDLSILSDDTIRSVIELENEIGSKSGLAVDAHRTENESNGSELDVPDAQDNNAEGNAENPGKRQQETQEDRKNLENILKKKIQSYYTKLLLFAFITKDRINSLSKVIESLQEDNNKRIAKNLGLEKNVLSLINEKTDKFVLSGLDYKIQDINGLSQGVGMSAEEKAAVAVKKFGKLGDAIVITPSNICDDMVALLPQDFLVSLAEKHGKILDIAGTSGEFAVALCKRMKEIGLEDSFIKDAIYTIPKSSVCYELTRKLYEMLGLNVKNIAKEFTASELLKLTTDSKLDFQKIEKLLLQNKAFEQIKLSDNPQDGEDNMKFDAIVGNPPYQEIVGNANSNKSLGKQLFPSFIIMSTKFADMVSLITPSKWFTAKGQDGSYPKLREYVKNNNHFEIIKNHLVNDVFPEVTLGSLNYFLYNKNYTGNCKFCEVTPSGENEVIRPLFENGMDKIFPFNIMSNYIEKITKRNDFVSLMTKTTSRNPFGVPDSNDRFDKVTTKEKDDKHKVKILCAYEEIRWIESAQITRNKSLVKKWKVFTSKMNGGAGNLFDDKKVAILGRSFIGEPNSICSGALIAIGSFEKKTEAVNLQKYMKTTFLRFLVGMLKSSQALYQNVYQYVPLQDFTNHSDIDWSKSISNIDKQLFKKYELAEEEISFIKEKILYM